MAVGSLTKERIDLNYTEISAHERELGLVGEIASAIALLFYISQAEEAMSPIDFFSGRNLPITECFEDMNASYELIKMGINKHSFIALRVALDNGLMAAYWKVVGHRTRAFKNWLQSIDPTPQKIKAFWETIMAHPSGRTFFAQFELENDIRNLNELSNYVHTRGSEYSTVTDFQKKVRSQNSYVHFDNWHKTFKASVRVVVILQLLVNPKLSIYIPDNLLLRKFGTYDKIPFMGVLFGEHVKEIKSVVGLEEYEVLVSLANDTDAVKSVLEYIHSVPNLSDDQIREMIIAEQKKHILEVGFAEWYKNRQLYDYRIDDKLTLQLQSWVEGLKPGTL